jgi:hypothetical protein
MTIDNPLEYASKLRKSFDYLSSKWCAEAMIEFAKGLQRLSIYWRAHHHMRIVPKRQVTHDPIH